jgi:hypothetical protein
MTGLYKIIFSDKSEISTDNIEDVDLSNQTLETVTICASEAALEKAKKEQDEAVAVAKNKFLSLNR